MKILAISGSPRKGNTDFLLDSIAEHVDTDILKLRKKRIKYCGGGDDCCPKTGRCVINDDMVEIYAILEPADIIILASPAYFSNVSALMKNFMDRCNPYYFNKKLKGKKFFLIGVAAREKSAEKTIEMMKEFVKGVHGNVIGEKTFLAEKIDGLKNKTDGLIVKEIAEKLR
jgi:multimeric flavodoxin WrbA